jgi:hypothetical protein
MRGNEIDHRLVDPFLGHILVSYKVDDMDLETAVSKIAFLVAASSRRGRSKCDEIHAGGTGG